MNKTYFLGYTHIHRSSKNKMSSFSIGSKSQNKNTIKCYNQIVRLFLMLPRSSQSTECGKDSELKTETKCRFPAGREPKTFSEITNTRVIHRVELLRTVGYGDSWARPLPGWALLSAGATHWQHPHREPQDSAV